MCDVSYLLYIISMAGGTASTVKEHYSIDKLQTDMYETVDSNDLEDDVIISDVNMYMVNNIAYCQGDVVETEPKSTNQIQQSRINKLYNVL